MKRLTKSTLISLVVDAQHGQADLSEYKAWQIEKLMMMLEESSFRTKGKEELEQQLRQEIRDRKISLFADPESPFIKIESIIDGREEESKCSDEELDIYIDILESHSELYISPSKKESPLIDKAINRLVQERRARILDRIL